LSERTLLHIKSDVESDIAKIKKIYLFKLIFTFYILLYVHMYFIYMYVYINILKFMYVNSFYALYDGNQ